MKVLCRLLMACVMLAAGQAAFATDSIESRPLQFAKGASSATVKGSLKGDKIIDYKVKASKSGDMWSIEVNDYEHYRIPEAVISGG